LWSQQQQQQTNKNNTKKNNKKKSKNNNAAKKPKEELAKRLEAPEGEEGENEGDAEEVDDNNGLSEGVENISLKQEA
jgi:hypothetical protein